MLTQSALLDLARTKIAEREQRAEPVTHYRVSKELGITSAYMTQLTRGTSIMSSDIAHKLAVLADVAPGYAMACIEAERAERGNLETTGTWRALAEMMAGKAASVLLVGLLGFAGAHDARAATSAGFLAHSPPEGARPGMYIMLN